MEKSLVKDFLNSLFIEYKVRSKLESELNRRYGKNFNIFEILKIKENQISDMIAELLKPSGFHGQGAVFLKLFLEEIFKKIETQTDKCETEENIILPDLNEKFLTSSKIEREYITDEGKFIDILIRLPEFYKDGNLIIAVENKPWAKEQEDTQKDYRQIEHYVKFLEKLKNASKIRDFVFIYLSEDREAYSIDRNEKENLKKQGRFLELSYTDFLISWLTLCKKYCNAEKVKLIINDFINWILKNFKNDGGDKMFVEVLKNWVSELGDSQEKVKLLYEVYKNFPDFVRQRFKELFEEIITKLKPNYIYIEGQIEMGENFLCLWIYNKNWEKYEESLKDLKIINYAFQVNNITDFKNFYWEIGLCRPENKGKLNYENYKNLELKTKLEKLIEKIKKEDPEYKYQDNEWWKMNWWIIRKQIEDPDLIFKIFTESRAEEIVDEWYKEIEALINNTINELNDNLK